MVDQRLKIDITAQDRSAAAFRSVRGQITKTSGAMTKFLKGFGGGVLGASILAGLVNPLGKASEALNEFDKLSKRARQSGLDSDFFQALQLAAEEANFSQETLNRSILAFNKRRGELIAGTGPLVSSLKFVDAELLEQLKTTTSTEQALRVLADRLSETDDASRKAAIASAAFSRAGIEMVEVLQQGSAGLDETARKARELGLIIDKDLLRRSEEINNEFGVTNRVLGIQFKKVLVDLGPTLVSFSKGLLSVSEGIATIDKNTRSGIAGLKSFLGLAEKVQLKESEIGLFKNGQRFKGGVNQDAKGDFLGIREVSLANDIVDGPINQASGALDRFRSEASENFDSLAEDSERSAGRVESAFVSAFDALDLTGNRVLDGLLSQLLKISASEFFGGRSLGNASGASTDGTPLGLFKKFFGGGFAAGGVPPAGKFSLTGERGPELIMGDGRARVFPNDSLGGKTTVNIFNNTGAEISRETRSVPGIGEIIDIVIGSPKLDEKIDGRVRGGTAFALQR